MTTLDARNITVAFGGTPVLSDVAITARSGSFVGLIGPNGSGKSTLLRSLMGLQRLESGQVSIDDVPLADLPITERARRLSYLPAGTEVHWPLLAERLVALGRIPNLDSWRGLRETDFEAVTQALNAVDVLHLRKRVVTTLSTGERARVLLARALASSPRILLADEPVAALDVSHQLLVLDVIRDLCMAGMTAVVVFHDLSLAARYCTDLVLLREGRVFAAGAPGDVLVPDTLRDAYGVRAALTTEAGVPQVVSYERLTPSDDHHGQRP